RSWANDDPPRHHLFKQVAECVVGIHCPGIFRLDVGAGKIDTFTTERVCVKDGAVIRDVTYPKIKAGRASHSVERLSERTNKKRIEFPQDVRYWKECRADILGVAKP